MIPFF